MPFINVNVQTVKEVSHEIEGLDESLINNYFKQMTDRINDLISNANGIKSADIKSTLSTVSSEVETLQNDIKNNLSGLETDIAEVLKNYEVNTEAALEKLVALFNVMQGFSENGTFNFTSSDAIDYMEEKGANDSPDTIEEPVEDDRVWYQRAWDSLKGNYVQNEQEFFGFFSGAGIVFPPPQKIGESGTICHKIWEGSPWGCGARTWPWRPGSSGRSGRGRPPACPGWRPMRAPGRACR